MLNLNSIMKAVVININTIITPPIQLIDYKVVARSLCATSRVGVLLHPVSLCMPIGICKCFVLYRQKGINNKNY